MSAVADARKWITLRMPIAYAKNFPVRVVVLALLTQLVVLRQELTLPTLVQRREVLVQQAPGLLVKGLQEQLEQVLPLEPVVPLVQVLLELPEQVLQREQVQRLVLEQLQLGVQLPQEPLLLEELQPVLACPLLVLGQLLGHQ
jgi:hypothetical protein